MLESEREAKRTMLGAAGKFPEVRLLQDRHLASLCHSNFLWLICPDGYVGQSASLELGFAIARGLPIYAEHLPDDLTLRQYVHPSRFRPRCSRDGEARRTCGGKHAFFTN